MTKNRRSTYGFTKEKSQRISLNTMKAYLNIYNKKEKIE